ncbi:MAG: metal-dependent transcriptional regulator [Erysipelotrichales bacterium]|nr:metal-dependent transcriptional regulator [Erysipelotrichales bacterium]
MKIEKTAEDYLEAMLMLKEEKGYIRSVDVAEHLGVTKPSVTYTTKRLRESGLIVMDKDGEITITEEGMVIAERTYSRHKILTDFLLSIGVSEENAREDACKLEHDFSEESFDALVSFIKEHS